MVGTGITHRQVHTVAHKGYSYGVVLVGVKPVRHPPNANGHVVDTGKKGQCIGLVDKFKVDAGLEPIANFYLIINLKVGREWRGTQIYIIGVHVFHIALDHCAGGSRFGGYAYEWLGEILALVLVARRKSQQEHDHGKQAQQAANANHRVMVSKNIVHFQFFVSSFMNLVC